VNVLIIDNGTKHIGRLKKLLLNNNINTIPLFEKYEELEKYDLIVLSGGSQFSIINAPEVFKEEISLVRTSRVPILGICQGCEIIAYAFDSKMQYFRKKSHGLKRVEVLVHNSIFGEHNTFKVFESHHWGIGQLGNNLKGLAKSKTGFEVITHITRPIYGLQFHPEMLPDLSYGDDIFLRIVGKLTGQNHSISD